MPVHAQAPLLAPLLDSQQDASEKECDICGKNVKAEDLAKHRRAHLPADVRGGLRKDCDICGKTLRTDSLRRHRKLHFPEIQSELRSKCDICGMIVKNSYLAKHRRTRHANIE